MFQDQTKSVLVLCILNTTTFLVLKSIGNVPKSVGNIVATVCSNIDPLSCALLHS